jgi:hypothetical protein
VKNGIFTLLLVLGIPCWLFVGDGYLGQRPVAALTAAAVGAAVALLAVRFGALRILSPEWRYYRAAALSVFAFAFLYQSAISAGHTFVPSIQDEQCYLIQARMVQEGRLWMPKHELGEAFGSLYMIIDPVYASKYPPFTAIVFAAGMSVGIPVWAVVVGATSLAVGLFHVLACELFDDLYGTFGALMLVFLPRMNTWALYQMSHPIMTLLSVATVFVFMRWFKRPRYGTAVAIGLLAGTSFITRPFDTAVHFAVLTIAATVYAKGLGYRRVLAHAATAAVVAIPFLAFQVVINKSVTGRYTTMPWSHYSNSYDPYDDISLRVIDPSEEPECTPLKRAMLDESRVRHNDKISTPAFTRAGKQIASFLDCAPHPVSLALIPVAVLALRKRWWVVALPFATACAYSIHSYPCSQYAMPTSPYVVVLILSGVSAVARPGAVSAVLLSALLAVAVSGQNEVLGAGGPRMMADVQRQMDGISGPAVVFIDKEPNTVDPDPCYNVDTAWPDDARVVKVYDRTPAENDDVLAYYARRQPQRTAYRLERDGRLTLLGRVTELAGTSLPLSSP